MREVLEGIRVVEVAQWWFVPAAGAVLADWGAEVLKVEHPETGDPMRGLISSGLIPGAGKVNFMVEQPNRGKRGIGIDLAKPDGLDLLYRLVETADVFLTSFLPAARRTDGPCRAGSAGRADFAAGLCAGGGYGTGIPARRGRDRD